MLFPFQKYTSRREIDTSIFTSPWTAFLNSSIQTSPLLLACCSRLFSARSNRVERCVLRSLRFGLAGNGGGRLSIYRTSSPPTNVANGLWNASLSTG